MIDRILLLFISAKLNCLVLNVMMYRGSYETAPVFALMEKVVLSKMREYIGWPVGDGDGILSPGRCKYDTSSYRIRVVWSKG